jgi:myo-inositol catabolism protein IolS
MLGFPDFPIGFGAASISGEGGGYGFGAISERDAVQLLEQAFHAGIRLYDTAPIYGFGLSEKRIGLAFQQKREDVFYVSKGGVTWDQNKRVDKNNHPDVIQKMLEQSLRDLNTDYIDLYMIHWPDERHDIRPAMEVLTKAKAQNKIRFIGLCNTNERDFKKVLVVLVKQEPSTAWAIAPLIKVS